MCNCLQPIKESALGNIPTIAFCDTDSPMRYVDIGIPANNKGRNSIGCLFWLLARMVLQMRGTILPGHKWEVMVRNLRMMFNDTGICNMCGFFFVPLAFLCDNVVCRLICSSTETLRKQRSRRRKLLRPLTLLQSLITKPLISGVVTSGPLMWLHSLLLLVALVPNGVLLQVCTDQISSSFVWSSCRNLCCVQMDSIARTFCAALCCSYKFVVVTQSVCLFCCSSGSCCRWLGSRWGPCTCGWCCSCSCCSYWLGPSSPTPRTRLGVGLGPRFVACLLRLKFSIFRSMKMSKIRQHLL